MEGKHPPCRAVELSSCQSCVQICAPTASCSLVARECKRSPAPQAGCRADVVMSSAVYRQERARDGPALITPGWQGTYGAVVGKWRSRRSVLFCPSRTQRFTYVCWGREMGREVFIHIDGRSVGYKRNSTGFVTRNWDANIVPGGTSTVRRTTLDSVTISASPAS